MVSTIQRLDLRQSQSLVMTPQLQQAIKLLQMSSQELQEFVDQEIESNPLLERAGDEGVAESDGPVDTDFAAPISDLTDLTGSDRDFTDTDHALDTDFDNVWTGGESGMWQESAGNRSFGDDDWPGLEQTLTRQPDLREHLVDQVRVSFSSMVDQLIAYALIDGLNEAGYLAIELSAVAAMMGCAVEDVARVLDKVQHFEPAGVFARDLRECLMLQLRDRNRYDPCIAILLDHLPLLAERKLDALKKLCRVDDEDLRDMIADIRALEPKPARTFVMVRVETMIPDVLVRPSRDGGWAIELNPDALPKLLLNRSYYTEISSSVKDRGGKDYLAEKWQSASWLMKALDQRAQTILKVSAEIIRQQDGFFREGVRRLRPLILRDIAEAVQMHESTISRVTTNKYMATPRGIFELKFFFTAAIPSADGGASHAAEAAKHHIKTLIDGEISGKILSDDQIVDLLRDQGIDIARRTVAKYREAMRIPSSVQRRRDKAQD